MVAYQSVRLGIFFVFVFLPEVFSVIEVPGRGVAHHLASVRRLLQHGLVPELLWHWYQAQRGEKIV